MVILASGIGLTQILYLAITPVLTRLYTPEDFGILAVFGATAAVWGVVSSLRYEYSIPLPEDSDLAASLLVVGAFVLGVQSVVGLALTILFGASICRSLNVPELAPWIWLLPFDILVGGLYGLFYMWALRLKAYRPIATSKVTQGLWRAALQCGLGLLHIAPGGLLLGLVAGQGAGWMTLGRLARRNNEGAFSRVTIASAKYAARRYVRFATYGSAAGLLNVTARQMTPLVLVYLFGVGVAGQFGLAQRVLAVPVGLVGAAVSEAYIGVAPELLRERPAELRRLFSRLTKRFAIVGILPALLIIIAGPWLFSLVFGQTWYTAGHYARLLTPAVLMDFIVYPISQTANIFERQDLQSIADLACLAMLIAVFVASSRFEWSADMTVLGASVSMCLYAGLCLSLYWRLLWKRSEGRDSLHDSDPANR